MIREFQRGRGEMDGGTDLCGVRPAEWQQEGDRAVPLAGVHRVEAGRVV